MADNEKDAKVRIDWLMGSLIEMLATHPYTQPNERAWRQLLAYAPASLFERIDSKK